METVERKSIIPVVAPASTPVLTTNRERLLLGVDLETLPPEPAQQLVSLLSPSFFSYEWFDEGNRSKAREGLKALVRALLDTMSEPADKRDLIEVYKGLVVSEQNRDRADRASALLPEKPEPIIENKIPQEKVKRHSYGSDEYYKLQLEKVTNWVVGIPHERAGLIGELGYEALPDAFYLATYKLDRVLPDPILYAKYGEWYVKVAEWK